MGMTIEEEDRYMNACIKYLQKNMECVGYRDYIIERLNKYQQIEQAIRNYDIAWEFHTLRGTIDKIREVIEDGNNR